MTAALAVARFDLATVRSYLKTLALFLACMALLAWMNGPLTVLPIFTLLGTIVASYPFSVAEKDGTDVMLACLPVGRRAIVAGRYLFAVVDFVLLLVLGLAVALLIQGTTGQSPIGGLELAGTAAACFALYSLLIAIQFPLYFRFGYAKMRLISLLPLAALGAVVGIAVASLGAARQLDVGQALVAPGTIALLVLAALVALAASFALTVRTYRRMDI